LECKFRDNLGFYKREPRVLRGISLEILLGFYYPVEEGVKGINPKSWEAFTLA
jgi:hypothetical protein